MVAAGAIPSQSPVRSGPALGNMPIVGEHTAVNAGSLFTSDLSANRSLILFFASHGLPSWLNTN